jgi:hypothetical protein
MTFTHAQLKAEITNYPKPLGYSTYTNPASPNYRAAMAIINATYAGVGIVWRPDIPSIELLSQLVWTAEVAGFTAVQAELLSVMLIPLKVDATQATVRSFFAGLFSTCPLSLANLTAIAKVVSPTRAEELWGAHTFVGEQDMADAINLA